MSQETLHLLVVDDQESIRKLCVTVGASLGLRCTQAESAEAALARLETEAADMVLADLMMPTMSGLDFVTEAKRKLAHAEIAITTPFRIQQLTLLMQRIYYKVQPTTENLFLRERVNTEMDLSGIIGSSTK